MAPLTSPNAQNLEQTKAALMELLGMDNKVVGYKHDATGTPTTTYAHGPGGVFSFPGVDPQVFSTTIGVESGIVGMLPKFPSVFTNPVYQSITGVQDDVGTEPVNVCDPAVVAGLIKACKLTSVFGRYRRQTRELYINRLGQRNDPADPMNLRLMNALIQQDGVFRPEMTPLGGDQVLQSELAKVLMEFGVSVNRLLARQLWTGNPANNTAGDGFKELTGFELLINTGAVDAETGVACPSLDSDIKDFNFLNVDGSG